MKSKSLCLTNGIVGLIGGILLILGPIFLLGTVATDLANNNGSTASGTFSIIFTLLKIAILVLGIVAIVSYKGTNLVSTAAHVLFIVGGALALIPFLGWIGGIIIVIGAGLYLASLKNFNKTAQE